MDKYRSSKLVMSKTRLGRGACHLRARPRNVRRRVSKPTVLKAIRTCWARGWSRASRASACS